MYPTISYLIHDLTGLNIALPIQTFGFMMALSFLAAAWTLRLELKRKEQLGLINTFTRKIVIGKPVTISELIISFVMGFVIGYKLLEVAFHYREFTDDPQTFILSTRGSLIGGLIAAAAFTAYRYYEKQKQTLPEPKEETVTMHVYDTVADITIVAAVSGLIGAKVFDSFENWDDFVKDPFTSLFSFSGLTFYGGLIFGAVGVLWYTGRMGVKHLDMADATAPGLILAYSVGRIGCHLSGDGDWGIVNTHPKPGWLSFLPEWMWHYNYPHNVISQGLPIPGCEGKFCYQLAQPVYPTAFYEIIWAFLIFVFLWSIRKRITTPGVMFCTYLILNGIERFTIETIRVNPRYHILGLNPSQAQVIAVSIFLIGVIGIIVLPRMKKKEPVNDSNAEL